MPLAHFLISTALLNFYYKFFHDLHVTRHHLLYILNVPVLCKGFGSDKVYLKLLLAHLRALDLMQYCLAYLSETLVKDMLPHLNFFIIDTFSLYLSWSSCCFVPAHLYINHHKPFLLSEPGSTFCCIFLLIIFLKIFVLGILVFIIILPYHFFSS